jgi:hypothetical protein
VSVYFGLSAGLQLLSVSFFRIALQKNVFANCSVRASAERGNAYGGAVSLYIGAYSSVYGRITDNAVAAVGATLARNVSVTLETSQFESCIAKRERIYGEDAKGANVYGGSFSFYIGAYSWSYSQGNSSSSSCGATDVIGVSVRLQNVSSLDSRALTSTSKGFSDGANSYGGSMSVLYVGAYSWTFF